MEQNLFMMCRQVNQSAFSELRPGYRCRTLRRDELPAWKAMPFDSDVEAREYAGFMDAYFARTYAQALPEFFARTLVIADSQDQMVATCLLWRAYRRFNSLHWLKVLKQHENLGLGRALLSLLLKDLAAADLPIYLHTQPESYRAIKLYTDFGFELLIDARIGPRDNHLEACLPYLEAQMPATDFARLRFATAPPAFHACLQDVSEDQF